MLDFLQTRKQRHNAEKNLKIYNSMQDVSDVAYGYQYWRKILINKIIRLFKWSGLPDTIPGVELEKQVLLFGKSGIVATKYGDVAVPAEPYGVGLYPDYKPFAVWATPLVSGDGVVNKDIFIIKNNAFLTGVGNTVDRYARMLADVESTLALTLVNVRQPSMAAAPDESTALSYQCANLAIRLGQTEAVLNTSILDDIKQVPAINTIPPTLLTDSIEARDRLLNAFFAEFGIAGKDPIKKAQISIPEMETNTQVMTINTKDMLLSRQEGAEIYTNSSPYTVTVDIDEDYKAQIERGEYNERSDDNPPSWE